ncbi:MAG TPA: DEAD/DEAH box helicase, partial [Archaeoglobus sp.]|nr:DEAD/DEAH box helicase [Archaeoglobus sp.]
MCWRLRILREVIMDIFNVLDSVMQHYKLYVKSFLKISDERIRKFVYEKLEQKFLWPDPLIQLNPAFEEGHTVKELVEMGYLHPDLGIIFPTIRLYKHQEEAILKALQRRHFVITSGTGSGKSLTYLIPIFDHILKSNPEKSQVRAIIVYPMNALVNSQLDAINRHLNNLPPEKSNIIRVARYTGQESDVERRRLQMDPPHVLLTNYVMLELIMTRPHEFVFIEEGLAKLAFLVLDEIHAYRGRQGADIALLVRRFKERCGNPDLIFIGTSATMASGDSRAERLEAVAQFSSKLFGVSLEPEDVIEETVKRIIPRRNSFSKEELAKAITGPLPEPEWSAFISNPLSCWIEETFGIVEEEDGHLRRREPTTLEEAATQLSEITGISKDTCLSRLKEMLLLGNTVKTPDGNPVFVFKIHQFISQGGSVYATIEHPDKRHITLEGQYFAPGEEERVLFPLYFCRTCGQEYYAVEWHKESNKLIPPTEVRGWLDEAEGEEENIDIGYLLIDPERKWRNDPDLFPDHWYDRNGSIKRDYRPYIPVQVKVKPNGEIVDDDDPESIVGWFLRSPFLLCLRCGESYTLRDKNDFRKLSKLSSEGRSTSTTILTLQTIAAMRKTDLPAEAQKILSFTDNRQDASLQAGHFNDFVKVALLRSALFHALEKYEKLSFDNIASRVVESMDLPLFEYSRQSNIEPESRQGCETRKCFEDVIEYRLYDDLKRGWRIVQPNLEQCGLLRVKYIGIKEIAQNDDLWKSIPIMGEVSPEKREEILQVLLDEMRRRLAIEVKCLDPRYQQGLRKRAFEYLNEFWAFDEGERLRYASRFVLPGNEKLEGDASLSYRSIIGRWLKSLARKELNRDLTNEEYDFLIIEIAKVLEDNGILIKKKIERRRNVPSEGLRLRVSVLRWLPGDGKPYRDPLRSFRAIGEPFLEIEEEANEFFKEFYRW